MFGNEETFTHFRIKLRVTVSIIANNKVRVLSPPQRLLFFKKPRKRGKGGKKGRERRKIGKGGKSAREREKRRKPLPDFCRNMAKVVDIRPHTA